jgi:hypothetical protein
MQTFKVSQHRGGMGWKLPTIEKTLNQEELFELGFFPLTSFELKEMLENNRTIIEGDCKYTVIEALEETV